MARDHHTPVNVTLTSAKRLTAQQHVGSRELVPVGAAKDWMRDPAMELSRAALDRMIAAGWHGYGKKRRRSAPIKLADCNIAAEWPRLPASVRDAVRNLVYAEIAEARAR